MTLTEQIEQWIISNKLVQINFKKNNIQKMIIAKLIKFDVECQNIISYDLDHKQVYNIGLDELENIEEY